MRLKKNSPPSPYAGKRVLVVGLGLHGGALGATRWFLRHGAQVRVTDAKNVAELSPTIRHLRRSPVTYHLGGLRLSDVRWADVIYQNQAIPDSLPVMSLAKKLKKTIVNEASLFFQLCPARIIGVTGTRGKSTTTALIRYLLAARFPRVIQTGNIRQRSMLEVLDSIRPADLVVAELSSFQLDFLHLARRSPQVAVVTNISADHLNRHGSMARYVAAKQEIVRYQHTPDVAVLNADNPWVRQMAKHTRASIIWFSSTGRTKADVSVRQDWIMVGRQRLIKRTQTKLPGQHNAENMAAAVAVVHQLGLPNRLIQRGLESFQPLPHRLELVRRWHGHECINDTTATSPEGTLAALRVYPQGLFIVGGTDKQLEFSGLAKALVQHHVPLVFLPGTATGKLRRHLRRFGYRARHHLAATMPEAVRAAIRLARPKQPIILSPGAASFGLFIHEFDRGEQFRRAVSRL